MKTKVRDLLEQLQRFDPDKDLEFQGWIQTSASYQKVWICLKEFERVVEESGTVVIKL